MLVSECRKRTFGMSQEHLEYVQQLATGLFEQGCRAVQNCEYDCKNGCVFQVSESSPYAWCGLGVMVTRGSMPGGLLRNVMLHDLQNTCCDLMREHPFCRSISDNPRPYQHFRHLSVSQAACRSCKNPYVAASSVTVPNSCQYHMLPGFALHVLHATFKVACKQHNKQQFKTM